MAMPRSQVYLELDAARFNREVQLHDETVGSINAKLEAMGSAKGDKARQERSELAGRRDDLIRDFSKRMNEFWYGTRQQRSKNNVP